MKRFFVCLFILAVFSGVVFYIGCPQFKISAGSMGVVVSKTSGVNRQPVVPGKISWNWQFILPTNAKLIEFNIKPMNVNRKISGQLPSGQIYTSLYNSSDAFSYEFDFSVSLSVTPESVVSLYEKNIISDSASLQDYLDSAASSVCQLAAGYYLSKAKEDSLFRPENVRREDLIKAVRVFEEFPEVDISVFALTNSKIPDFKLYQSMQTQTLSRPSLNNTESSSVDNSDSSQNSTLEGTLNE